MLLISFRSLLLPEAGFAQHAHINAGAVGSTAGSPLYFVNGGNYETNSGYVVNLAPATAGTYAGTYAGSITFTSLAIDPLNGGPAFGHAAAGAFLELQVVSVEGPEGGEFSFWDAGDTAPRITLRVGRSDGVARFALSESDASPGSDPYGHIHGREFTANQAGLYAVGFRLIDTSQNGPGGGPLHPPSGLFHLYFQAGLTLSVAASPNGGVEARFGTHIGNNYFLQATEDVVSGTWFDVAGPVAGNERLQSLADPSGMGGSRQRFYRIRVEAQ
ncbi:MAG TPA: hypothetical protein DCM86_14565 [Verrucomicrobiales bacterium]|nr:hypothetical protein [Verrucomicrobiales bacterium]